MLAGLGTVGHFQTCKPWLLFCVTVFLRLSFLSDRVLGNLLERIQERIQDPNLASSSGACAHLPPTVWDLFEKTAVEIRQLEVNAALLIAEPG